MAAANPVSLQGFDRLAPIEIVEPVEQPVSVFGDPQHPLPHADSRDRMSAPLALAVDDLLVGQHRPQRRAPVDGRELLIGQPLLVLVAADRFSPLTLDLRRDRQLGDGAATPPPCAAVRADRLGVAIEPGVEQDQKDPLRPAEVVGIGRRELALPVVAEAEHLQLAAERLDVFVGRLSRVRPRFDGVLLGRQTERVPAHRVQNVFAPHAVVAADDVRGGVTLRVPDVQTVPRRVGKHVQYVELLPTGAASGVAKVWFSSQ